MRAITTLRWRRARRPATIDFMLAAPLTIAMVMFGGTSAATTAPIAPLPHVRPLDPLAGDLLGAGSRVSPTFAALIDSLDHAGGLVVYVSTTSAPDPRGSITFVSRASNVTYLLIRVCTRQIGVDRVAVLAHELTHAVEIAQASTMVASERDLQRLYVCIGIDSSGKHLESEAAVRAERAVHRELGRAPEPAPAGLVSSSPAIQAPHAKNE
ncbi:MAG TPA: hypothetical protein VLT86_15855 [Vicinamibacterales bacterium]|nr:hypothetical protein [Vicinamibacterales bacterium]